MQEPIIIDMRDLELVRETKKEAAKIIAILLGLCAVLAR